LVKVLEIYGVPPNICNIVRRLYIDLKVVFSLGKSKVTISQSVGVRQGDNMAPVLFLFVMTAFHDLLENTWEENGIERVSVTKESDDTYRNGQLFRRNVKKCCKSDTLEEYPITDIIYVDNEALPFTSRAQLCKGMPLAQQLLADLGLEMHVGTHLEILSDDGSTELVKKASKTECIFFPSPGYFKQLAISNGAASENDILRLLDSNIEEDNNETRDERTSLEDSLYKSSPETVEVPMIDWFVSYFSHFKYLGTWISYTLRDDYNISMRIANSTKAMGALGNFYDGHEVSVQSKYLVFMAIPVNLLL
jgi:hypothetical protein